MHSGGVVGGMQWGSASDNSRIYVANHNSLFENIDLTKLNAVPNTIGSTVAPNNTNGGIVAAIEAFTGADCQPAHERCQGCGVRVHTLLHSFFASPAFHTAPTAWQAKSCGHLPTR